MQTNIQLLLFFARFKHTVKIYNHPLVYIHKSFCTFKHIVKIYNYNLLKIIANYYVYA